MTGQKLGLNQQQKGQLGDQYIHTHSPGSTNKQDIFYLIEIQTRIDAIVENMSVMSK